MTDEWSSVLRYPLTGIYVEGGTISFSGDGVVPRDGGFDAGSWYLCDNVLTTVSSGFLGSRGGVRVERRIVHNCRMWLKFFR